MKQAYLYSKLKDKSVKCWACSRYCRITPGLTGVCGIRQNIGGKLFLLTYGKPLHGLAEDPVEKKPLYHFLPGSRILSFGTYGCNFGCEFCQNWEMSQFPKLINTKSGGRGKAEMCKGQAIKRLKKEINKIETWMPERIVDYALKNKIPSIAYTYNEPAVFFEYAYDTAKRAHQKGVKNVFVSNGYESKEALAQISPYLDAINIDLKAFSNKFYLTICKAEMHPVLDNIRRCFEEGIWMEVTTLVIPTLNDSSEELRKTAEFLASVSLEIPWHLSAYHPDYNIRDIPSTPMGKLVEAYSIGKKAGLKYVYIGNVQSRDFSITRCHRCNEVLIRRNWNIIEEMNLERGRCGKCKTEISGIWE